METASLIVSIIAIIGSIFTYLYHDRKIKNQEKRLNDYQLKRFELDDIENNKAQIKGDIIKIGAGNRSLRIFNAGKSTAHNIRLETLSEPIGIIGLEFTPYEMLNPQEKTETSFLLTEGHAPTLKVRFIWNDNYKENNEYIQVITI
ncbi:hypothetical protein [Microbacter margulisiae]|uniref:Uncharacterized protein n=1 Tax=Microbacter margulisiae TaxID=1350067 RepID=A0A7W5DNK6_9PORP|nr:hypothetical protein [Microbacter margulisiae]MBB3186235.1 hypothetical protein [Microbacter margulisiae]